MTSVTIFFAKCPICDKEFVFLSKTQLLNNVKSHGLTHGVGLTDKQIKVIEKTVEIC